MNSALFTKQCWGGGWNGQKMSGNTNHMGYSPSQMGDNLPPAILGGGFVPVQMTCGIYHACVLSQARDIKCFGQNKEGCCGYGHANAIESSSEIGDNLAPVDLGDGFVPIQVEAGEYSTCAVAVDGRVKCWGKNHKGQLGLGDLTSRGKGGSQMGDFLPAVDLGDSFHAIKLGKSKGYYHCAISDTDGMYGFL